MPVLPDLKLLMDIRTCHPAIPCWSQVEKLRRLRGAFLQAKCIGYIGQPLLYNIIFVQSRVLKPDSLRAGIKEHIYSGAPTLHTARVKCSLHLGETEAEILGLPSLWLAPALCSSPFRSSRQSYSIELYNAVLCGGRASATTPRSTLERRLCGTSHVVRETMLELNIRVTITPFSSTPRQSQHVKGPTSSAAFLCPGVGL